MSRREAALLLMPAEALLTAVWCCPRCAWSS